MQISSKHLESLVETVVLPFEKLIIEDPKLSTHIAPPAIAKLHNMAVAKLSVYIYSDINRAYSYIQEGAKAHKENHIPVESLKEYYTLYFLLCREWNKDHLKTNAKFEENIATIEQFVYEAFANENETKAEFFDYDSEVINADLTKMHYTDEQKISAQDFHEEGSMDELDIQDILECSDALQEAISDTYTEHDKGYFENVNTRVKSYAVILEKNLEFRDIGYSLSKLSSLLEEHCDSLVNHEKKKALLVILNAIVEDLIAWTVAVLKEKTAIDIHYLDASLLSSILQFEMMILPPKDDEDDLEFF
jgi:hypothetical protein